MCRTDLHVVDGDLVAWHFPLVLGHQIVGERLDTGERGHRRRIRAVRRRRSTVLPASPGRLKDPLDRLKGSLDGAEAALKDLRTGASKGTGELVRDLEKTLKHLRSNARKVGREVSKDLAAAGREATKSSPRKPAARWTAKRPATTTRRKASAGKSK